MGGRLSSFKSNIPTVQTTVSMYYSIFLSEIIYM